MGLCFQLLFVSVAVGLVHVAQCVPKPSTPTPDFDLVLHDEYLAFGQWVDDKQISIDDMSPVLVNKQLQMHCFQELRPAESRNNTLDGFYVSTADKFDTLYGTWKIRAKLPAKTRASMRIALMDSQCGPTTARLPCPPAISTPAAMMRLHPAIPSDIEFTLTYPSFGTAQIEQKTTRKLPKYSDSFHTYEFAWMPDMFEWRIDGKVVAGIFDPKMIPQTRMSFHVSAFCGDDSNQPFDADDGFIISSAVYSPASSSAVVSFVPAAKSSSSLTGSLSSFLTGSAETTERPTRRTTAGFWGRRTTSGLEEEKNEDTAAAHPSSTSTSSAFDRSVDLIAEQYKIIMDAIKKIAGIAVRINDNQWITELGLAKSKMNI